MRGRAVLVAALVAAGAGARAEEPTARVVLRWNAISGAAAYDLQVSKDETFARPELEVRVEPAGHRLGPPPVEGRRYWRVRSVDVDGRPGPWSDAKVIEPLARVADPPPAARTGPTPDPVTLDVPPPSPAPLPPGEEGTLLPSVATAPVAELAARGDEGSRPSTLVPDWTLQGPSVFRLLDAVKPGLLIGWRANLLGVDALEVAVEGALPLPWLGTDWRAALRTSWWRERSTVPTSVGLSSPRAACADVVPISVLLLRTFPAAWARLYAGAGAGVHLVVIRFREQGSLDASGALVAVAGAGHGAGPGELFGELSAGLGGVDGPLGRLRTGGISLAVGYRLGR